MKLKLHTLHECLQDAALLEICKKAKLDYVSKDTLSELMRVSSGEYVEDSKKGQYTQRCSFCLDIETAEAIKQICIANGATVSSFLRACCKQLIEEYNYDAGKTQRWQENYASR